MGGWGWGRDCAILGHAYHSLRAKPSVVISQRQAVFWVPPSPPTPPSTEQQRWVLLRSSLNASESKKVVETLEVQSWPFCCCCDAIIWLKGLFPAVITSSLGIDVHVGLTTLPQYILHFNARQDKLETDTMATTHTKIQPTSPTSRPHTWSHFKKLFQLSTVETYCGPGLDSRGNRHINTAIRLPQGSPKLTTTQHYNEHGPLRRTQNRLSCLLFFMAEMSQVFSLHRGPVTSLSLSHQKPSAAYFPLPLSVPLI